MRLLLHMMWKDIKYYRGILSLLWILLGYYAAWPWLCGQSITSQWMGMGLMAVILFVPFLLMGLLLGWLDLDHPLHTDRFLATRPVGVGIMSWLPKLGLWAVGAALPAWVAVMVQLAGLDLDLRVHHYVQAGSRVALMMTGGFGILAMIGAGVRQPKHTVIFGILVMVFLLGSELSLSHLPEAWGQLSDTAAWKLEMKRSRLLAAWQVAGLAGFVWAAVELARARLAVQILGLSGVVLACLAVLLYWPVNGVGTTPAQAVSPVERQGTLDQAVTLLVTGSLHKPWDSKSDIDSDPHYGQVTVSATTTTTSMWCDTTVNEASLVAKPALGDAVVSAKATDNVLAGRNSLAMPPQALVPLLNLPLNLIPQVGEHLGRAGRAGSTRAHVPSFKTDPLSIDGRVRIEGTVTCHWFAPHLLGSLPLRAGASFALQGRSITVQEVRVAADVVIVKLRTLRFSMNRQHLPNDLDREPDFALSLANVSKGEIGLRHETVATLAGTPPPLWFAEWHEGELHYSVMGAQGLLKKLDPSWIKDARLYVTERLSVGASQLPFSAVLEVKP